MKNKLLKSLLVSILAATALSACNSGADSSNSPNLNANGTQTTATQTDSQAIGAEGGLLNIIGGNIEEAITEQVGSVLWNLVTKGQAFPQTAAQWDKQALISIQQNIQQIEATLNAQNTKLNTIISDITNSTLANSNLTISNYLVNINDNVTDVENLVQYILPANESSTAIVNALITGNAQPFSNQQIESLTSYVNNYSISVTTPEYTSTIIDTTEQQLSCDPSTTGNTYYVLNNPSQNALSHPMPNLASTCLLSVALNNAYNDLTQNVQLSGGTNIFYNLQSFDQMLDTQYLQIVQALTTAYYLDQLRLYLYVNLQSANHNNIAPLLTIDPNSNNLTNLATAQAELQLAYNTRLSFVQALFAETKQNAFNYYAGAIPSASLENNCNFSESSIEGVESSALTADMSDSNNLYGWDGAQLRMTCQNKRNPAQAGTITTTSNIAKMCNVINGSYNLQSSNGYIRCGGGSNYGNYSVSNINSTQEPTSFFEEYYLLQDIPSYDGANGDQLNYPELVDSGSGNLWMYFKGQALQNYQYNSYSSDGIAAAFQQVSSSFVDIDMNSYNSSGYPSGATSQWSYVDDGQHAYLISGAWIDENGFQGRPVIMCIPNDSNCVQGYFPNTNGQGVYPSGPSGYSAYQAIMFSNGDEITMTGLMGHGDYNIQTFYNGAAAPIAMGGHNPAINFSNVSYN